MNIPLSSKNLLPIVNIGIIILLLLVTIFKKGDLQGLDGQLAFFTDKLTTVERMQNEMAQKDTLLTIIRTENEQMQKFLLRQYEVQTIKFNKQHEEFIILQERLKNLNLKLENLNSAVHLSVLKSDSSFSKLIADTTTRISKDSIYIFNNYAFQDTSKHLKLNGTIDLKKNEAFFSYKYNANYEIITSYEKEGFGGRRKLIANLISDDPNSLVQLKSIYIKQPTPKLSIGVGVGAGATYSKNKFILVPSIQVGIYKPIINIY